MGNKEELIKSLASSFGMQDSFSTRYSESKFDPATGTLYCEGITIPKSTMQKALEYFSKQKEYSKSLASKEPALMDQYLINVVAANAIMMLMSSVSK